VSFRHIDGFVTHSPLEDIKRVFDAEGIAENSRRLSEAIPPEYPS
jgi:hypothetical protein